MSSGLKLDVRTFILLGLGLLGVGLLTAGALNIPGVLSGEGPALTCAEYLGSPDEGPVRLNACRLDFQHSVVRLYQSNVTEVIVALAPDGEVASTPYVLVSVRDPALIAELGETNWEDVDFEAYQRSSFGGYVSRNFDPDVEGETSNDELRNAFGTAELDSVLFLGTPPDWRSVLLPGIPGLLFCAFAWLNLWGPWAR